MTAATDPARNTVCNRETKRLTTRLPALHRRTASASVRLPLHIALHRTCLSAALLARHRTIRSPVCLIHCTVCLRTTASCHLRLFIHRTAIPGSSLPCRTAIARSSGLLALGRHRAALDAGRSRNGWILCAA